MSLDNVGTQVSQQMLSTFKSSMKEYDSKTKENKEKVKRYAVDKPMYKAKTKAIGKAKDELFKGKAEEQMKAGKDVLGKKAKQKATDIAGDAFAPATGGVSKAASKVANKASDIKDKTDTIKDKAKDGKDKTSDIKEKIETSKDVVSKGGKGVKGAIAKNVMKAPTMSKNSKKEKENPDRSSAIVSSSKNVINKAIDLGR